MSNSLSRRVAANGVVYYVSPLLEQAGVLHGFSTRLGGISPPPFDSMNLGNPSNCDIQDDGQRIQNNYRLLQEAIGCADKQRCSVHQVHGRSVVVVAANQPFEYGMKADALVSDDSSRVMSVRIADCVPILLAGNDGRCVAAVHAGWRGIVAGIVLEAVKAMRKLAGGKPLLAAIGPAIGPDAFEVGEEVLAQYEAIFGSVAPLRHTTGGRGHIDLRAALQRQLLGAGIGNIDSTDLCTFQDAAEFYSHRRDHGVTGRMAALIVPRQDQFGR